MSSVDYLLCGLHINMGGLDTHTHTHTHARRRGSARQLTCRDAGAASRFVTETGQSASAQGEFYECVNVGDNFPCLEYFIAVIPNRYLRKINTEVKDLSQDD